MPNATIYQRVARFVFIGLIAVLIQTPETQAEYRNPAVPGQDTAAYWMDKGGLYSTYGNFPAAIRAFEKSLALSPNNSEAYFDMGVAYGEMGDDQSALENMSKAIRLDPTNGRYLYGRAWIMVRSGRQQEARAEMTRAANLGSADAILYLQRIGAGR